MAVTADLMTTWQVSEGGQFGGRRLTTYRVGSMQVANADRVMSQTLALSGGLSAWPITFGPLGASAPGRLLQVWCSDPVDLGINSVSHMLSNVYGIVHAGSVSALYVTTGSAAMTTLRIDLAGGSNTIITTSLPL